MAKGKRRYGYNLTGALRKDLRSLQGFRTVGQELIQNAEDAGTKVSWMDLTAAVAPRLTAGAWNWS